MTNRIGQPIGVGQILIDASLNTKTSPGLSFVGDTDTGIFRDASGNISVSINDTLLLTINTSGELVVPTGYESGVSSDEVITNKRYVDDAISTAISLLPSFQSPMTQDLNDFLVVGASGDFEDKTPAQVITILGLNPGGANDVWVKRAGDTMDLNANINFNGGEVLGLPATPTGPTAAVSMAYVETVIAGRDNKEHCIVATTTYLDNVGNGTWVPAGSGVGKTITAGTAGVTTIDSYALQDGDRVLVKDEDGSSTNLTDVDQGIYVASATGAGSQTVLTRATDSDGSPSNEVSGGNFTFIQQGVTNSGSGWMVSGTGDIVVDTNPIVWIQVSDTSQIIAGIGLDFVGNVLNAQLGPGLFENATPEISLDLYDTAASALILTTDGSTRANTASAAKLHLLLEGSTLVQGIGGLKVQDNGITETQLNTSVAGDGLGGGGGTPLQVNVDGTAGVVISSDAVSLSGVPPSVLSTDYITFESFDGPSTGSTNISLGSTLNLNSGTGMNVATAGSTVTFQPDVHSVHGRVGAVVAASGDYTAAQITYNNITSGLTATEVQSAIDELAAAGAGTFIGLTDTPVNYTAQAGYWLRVNSTPNAVEFFNPAAITTAALIGVDPAGLINSASTDLQSVLDDLDAAIGGAALTNRIQDGDNNTYVEVDLAAGDDNTIRMGAGDNTSQWSTALELFQLSAAAGLTLRTANGIAGNVAGANMSITSGAGDNTGASGAITISTGDQTAAGATGDSGAIEIKTGRANASTNSGSLLLETGSASAGTAGDIILRAGNGSTDGVVKIDLLNDGTGPGTTRGTLQISGTDGAITERRVNIMAPASGSFTSDYTLVLPVDDGNLGEVLTTDGGGNLSWASAGASTFISLTDTPASYLGLPEISTVAIPNGAGAGASFTSAGTGDYFVLNSANDGTTYNIWYNVTPGTNTPPPGPNTPIVVNINVGDPDTVVALNTANAINLIGGTPFNAVPAGNLVTITNQANGVTTNIADNSMPVGTLFGTPQDGVNDHGVANELLQVNSASNALEFVDPSAVGRTTFVALDDTPANYSGAAGHTLRVNAGGTAVEFVPGASLLQDADGDTKVDVEESTDDDTLRVDLGDDPTGYGALPDALVLNSAGLTLNLGTATGTDTAGAPISLKAGKSSGSKTGGAVTIAAGSANGSGKGGSVNINAGDGGTYGGEGAVNPRGGDVNINAGDGFGSGSGAGNAGCSVFINAGTAAVGNADNGNGFGGRVWINGGSGGTGSSEGGGITLTGGAPGSNPLNRQGGNISINGGGPTFGNTGSGGDITLLGGIARGAIDTATGRPGNISLFAGSGDNTYDGAGGNVLIRGGNFGQVSATGNTGGNITLIAGGAPGTGTPVSAGGLVRLQAGDARGIGEFDGPILLTAVTGLYDDPMHKAAVYLEGQTGSMAEWPPELRFMQGGAQALSPYNVAEWVSLRAPKESTPINDVILTLRNTSTGNVTDSTAGTTGFTVTKVTEGSGAEPEVTHLNCLPAASLPSSGSGAYWTFNDGTSNYYVWYQIGTSADPTPGGTGIQVTLGGGETAKGVAQATETAVNGSAANSLARVMPGVILTLPASPGSANQSLVTDGANPATLSWADRQPVTSLQGQTTTAASLELSTDGAGGGYYDIASGDAHVLDINVIGQQNTGAAVAAWNIKVVIKNTGGTTALVGTAVTTIVTNTPGWAVAVTADDPNDRLAVTVTGAGGTTINWKASITAAVAP